jgi:hypothetical protein
VVVFTDVDEQARGLLPVGTLISTGQQLLATVPRNKRQQQRKLL